VTLAVTNAVMAAYNELQMEVLGPGDVDEGSVDINGGQITDVNFTPTAGEGGTTHVVVSANASYPQSLGTFTLTYSLDQTGTLPPEVGTSVAIEYQGQHAVFTFNATVGQETALTDTNAELAAYNELQFEVSARAGTTRE
jgi:hypothetical protein